ncbi:hypothetical protein [Nonomuraea sp. 10N515B]|uniref:hypothetical protein n=1 Tax=Nonomuraea sp. 10N515B TaxID=3457422 RepID=UPI003FCCFEF3
MSWTSEAFAAAGLPAPVPPGGLVHRSPLYKQVGRHFDAISFDPAQVRTITPSGYNEAPFV